MSAYIHHLPPLSTSKPEIPFVTSHHSLPQRPQFTLWFSPGDVHTMGFHICVKTSIHHQGIIHNSFLVLKILCSTYSSLHVPKHWQSWIFFFFYCLHHFAFFRKSYSWNHIGCTQPLQMGFFDLVICN